jgi:DNA-binding transcriptional ArsR family regulator
MSEDHTPPASSEGDSALRVSNPRSIRALAHPARLAIINALATGDELTATQCAELTELSPSATAYHLKLLERYGFAEPASPRGDRRERPWRATGRRTTFDLDSSTPAGASAASAVAAGYFDTTRAVALEFTAGEHAEPEEWRHAALSNADLWLTVEEVDRVSHELEAVLQPLRERALRGERPMGSRRVRVMNVVVPHPRTHPQPVPRKP